MSRELENLIGSAAMERLCAVFGGTKIHVSGSASCARRLQAIIGPSATEKVVRHYAGTGIEVPSGTWREAQALRASVCQDRAKGATVRATALKNAISERYVRMLCASNRPETEPHPTKV